MNRQWYIKDDSFFNRLRWDHLLLSVGSATTNLPPEVEAQLQNGFINEVDERDILFGKFYKEKIDRNTGKRILKQFSSQYDIIVLMDSELTNIVRYSGNQFGFVVFDDFLLKSVNAFKYGIQLVESTINIPIASGNNIYSTTALYMYGYRAQGENDVVLDTNNYKVGPICPPSWKAFYEEAYLNDFEPYLLGEVKRNISFYKK